MWQMWDKKPWESSGYPGVSSRYGYMDMSKNWVYQKKQNNGYIMLYMAILLEKMRINGQIWVPHVRTSPAHHSRNHGILLPTNPFLTD